MYEVGGAGVGFLGGGLLGRFGCISTRDEFVRMRAFIVRYLGMDVCMMGY